MPESIQEWCGTGDGRNSIGFLDHGFYRLLGQPPDMGERLPHRFERFTRCRRLERRLHFFFKNGEGNPTR